MNIRALDLIFILLLVINSSLCDECPDRDHLDPDNDLNLDLCKGLKTAQGYSSCCLLVYNHPEEGDGKSCIALTKDEVNDHSIALTQLLQGNDGASGVITCKEDKNGSAYLTISLFLYIILNLL